MAGIDSSFAATLTQNSNNLGEIRVEDCPIYFKENSESSESIKKLQRNKMSNKLQQKPEKQRTISSLAENNFKSIVSIKRTYKRLMKKINYDPLRNHNTKLKNGSKNCLTPSDSLHYGLALKQHYDRKYLMKPETLKRQTIKTHEQLEAIEKISLNSDLTKKFEEFSVDLLGKLSSINSKEKNDFPCYTSTDSTMHHHISKTLSAENDKKLSQSSSKNGNKILTPDNLNLLLGHEDFIDANLGSPHSLIKKNENSLENDIKIEPIDVIMSEDVIKSEDSESENSHHQEGTIEVFPVQDEKNPELHSTEYIEDVNKKRIKSTKHEQTKSKLAKTTLSENPKPIKQIFIYNNSENLLNETVDLLESDCESADNSNNRIPERTSEIFSAIQNIYKYSDNLLNETVDAYKSDCENADNSNNQIAETTSKVISSTQNIYNNRANLLNETVHAFERGCETADNPNNQIPETTSNILLSTQNDVVGEDHYDEEIRYDSTKTQISNQQHQEGTIEVIPVQDEKKSESHSTEYIKDVNKKRIKSIKQKTKLKQTIPKLAKKTLSENPKPIKQIFIYNNSESLLNETVVPFESDCESADNSNNRIPEITSEILSAIQNIYKNSDNLLNQTFDAYKSDCETADNSNNQIAETTSKVISSTQNIYKNTENLLNETVNALESDCETAVNSYNQLPETTSNILSSTQSMVVGEDHYNEEIRCDSTKSQITNRQHQEVTPVQDEKITESHSPENRDVKKKRNKSIKHRTKHKQIISKLAKKTVSENQKQIKQILIYNHSENLLNGKVHVFESNCESADNSNNQIAETNSKILSSIQNIYNSENLLNETGDVLESGCKTADNTNNQIPETTNKILLSAQNEVVNEEHFDEITFDSTKTQRSVEFLKNSVANNSDPKEKCCNRLSLLETCSVNDNCIENMSVESNSQSFGNCISKENRVRRTNLFHCYVNEEVPNKYVNVTIKPFEKRKDDSDIILEIDRAMETLINLRHLLTVNIMKSN